MHLILPLGLQILKYLLSGALRKCLLPLTGFISRIMSGLACWKLLSVQSFPASRHFTVVKIKAQEICVTLSKSNTLQCRELSFFQFSTHLLSFLQTLTASSAHRHILGSLPGQSRSWSLEGQGLCDSRTRDQLFGDVCKSVTIITIRYAWELCYRQRNNWIQILMCRHPLWASLESCQTSLGSLLPDAWRGLTCPADYHVPGSPPGSHIKQRSRLPGSGLWFSHRLTGFISLSRWLDEEGWGWEDMRKKEAWWEPKAFSTFWTWPQKSSPKWQFKVKIPPTPLGRRLRKWDKRVADLWHDLHGWAWRKERGLPRGEQFPGLRC